MPQTQDLGVDNHILGSSGEKVFCHNLGGQYSPLPRKEPEVLPGVKTGPDTTSKGPGTTGVSSVRYPSNELGDTVERVLGRPD